MAEIILSITLLIILALAILEHGLQEIKENDLKFWKNEHEEFAEEAIRYVSIVDKLTDKIKANNRKIKKIKKALKD